MPQTNHVEEAQTEIERRKGLPFASKVASLESALNSVRDLLAEANDYTVIRALTLLIELPESDQREVLAYIETFFPSPPEN